MSARGRWWRLRGLDRVALFFLDLALHALARDLLLLLRAAHIALQRVHLVSAWRGARFKKKCVQKCNQSILLIALFKTSNVSLTPMKAVTRSCKPRQPCAIAAQIACLE